MENLHRTPGVEGVSGKPLQLSVWANCAAYIIAATWSERMSERCVRNVWSLHEVLRLLSSKPPLIFPAAADAELKRPLDGEQLLLHLSQLASRRSCEP